MYLFSEIIPANTLKDNPVHTELVLDYGIIDQVIVNIPRGVFALAGFQVMQGNTQIFPANLGAWMTGDNLNQAFNIKIDLTNPPYVLQANYYNEDDTYEHTLTIQFSMAITGQKRYLHTFSQLSNINI